MTRQCLILPGGGEGHEWERPVTMPVAWTRRWGSGRIFATTLGHALDVLEKPEVHGLVGRGLDWAARRG